MHQMVESLISLIVELIHQIGYLGIFIGMFLESTIIPIPSEVIMIPAGMAAAEGHFNLYIATITGIAGNIAGAGFSYYLASSIGREILLHFGKWFFVKEAAITKVEKFFAKHGAISVFVGRLLPGFRHFISLPAGVAKMDLKKFYLYTSLGSTIWTTILSLVGFFVAKNKHLISANLLKISSAAVLTLCIVTISAYIIKQRKK